MNKLSKNQIFGVIIFLFIFIYSIMVELKYFNESRIIARIYSIPFVILGVTFFIYAIYKFMDNNNKK